MNRSHSNNKKENMRNYLSFGGGVNSVAMMLLMLEQKVDFEAVFVDHGTDWPETYEYFEMFQGWLEKNGHKPITLIIPKMAGVPVLYDYFFKHSFMPDIRFRGCTRDWKIRPLFKYYQKPCFQYLGIDWSEKHRAKIQTQKGVENRYPLIEAEIDRQGCKDIIKSRGLSVPMKSGCYICPFQKISQWRELRVKHPDLFCKAEQLEKKNMEKMKSKNKTPRYLSPRKMSLRSVIDEDQKMLFKEDEYPPCQCGL